MYPILNGYIYSHNQLKLKMSGLGKKTWNKIISILPVMFNIKIKLQEIAFIYFTLTYA